MAARLPVEIVQFISSNIDNVTTHLAFSQTCSTVRKLYDEKYWKNVLYSLGYGRSLIHKSIKWSFLPVMLTRHIATCVICQRVDAKHSYLKEGKFTKNAVRSYGRAEVLTFQTLMSRSSAKHKFPSPKN